MNHHTHISTEISDDTDVSLLDSSMYHLIVWNDEVNTFDWVTKTLVEVCNHDQHQAEQCTLFIHYKGKYTVKEGSYDTLKSMCDGITDRGIGATIEEFVC